MSRHSRCQDIHMGQHRADGRYDMLYSTVPLHLVYLCLCASIFSPLELTFTPIEGCNIDQRSMPRHQCGLKTQEIVENMQTCVTLQIHESW